MVGGHIRTVRPLARVQGGMQRPGAAPAPAAAAEKYKAKASSNTAQACAINVGNYSTRKALI